MKIPPLLQSPTKAAILFILLLFSSVTAFSSASLPIREALAQTSIDSIPTSVSSTHEIVVNPNTNMIYATSAGSNFVIVISSDTNSQVATITLARSVIDIAINPTNNLIYVTTGGSKSVIVIDGNTNSAISEITLSYYAVSIAVNPVTNMIYVSHGTDQIYSNLISVIDGNTNTVVASIQLDSSSLGDLGVNVNTNTIYFAGHYSNSVSVIHGGNNTVLTTIPVGLHPSKVAVNPATNRIYVTNYVDDTLSVIDAETNSVIATVEVGGYHPYTSLSNPSGVGIDTNANIIYVVNQYADCVNIIDGETNEVKDTLYIYGTQSVEYTNPVGVVINPNTGKAYVTNNSNTSGFISVIDYDESSPGSDSATLIVNTIDADTRNTIRGYYTTLSKDGSLQNWLYSPASFLLNNGETYSVSVYDYGNYVFDHWEDGSTIREREISITADTSITAAFRNTNPAVEEEPSTTAITLNRISPVPWGANVTITGTLKDGSGIGIEGKQITFSGTGALGLPSFVITQEDGTFSTTGITPSSVGSDWKLKATFGGDEHYTKSAITKRYSTLPHKTALSLTVSPNNLTAGASYKVVATLKDTTTNTGLDAKTITFTSDSPILIADRSTDSSGKAVARKLIAPSDAGSYDIQAHFAGDSLYSPTDSRTKALTVT